MHSLRSFSTISRLRNSSCNPKSDQTKKYDTKDPRSSVFLMPLQHVTPKSPFSRTKDKDKG